MNQGSVGKNKPVLFSFWNVELKFCCSVSHIVIVILKVILIIQENCNGRQPRIPNDFLKAMIWNSRNAVFWDKSTDICNHFGNIETSALGKYEH